jgi:NAD(P)-dependent dehydrogenase (short-subunit alcohol dehydrogenase family)
VSHLHGDCKEGDAVRMSFQIDKAGQAVAFARPEAETAFMSDDKQWREMTADPKFRRVLITNGRTPVGQEIVQALKTAGASTLFVGIAEPWKPFSGEDALRGIEGVDIVPLDVSDEKSVFDLAADIGGKVDILINTNEHIRPGGLFDRIGTTTSHVEIAQVYMGLVHLAQAFGSAMRSRGADGINSAAAWVNILSAYSLTNWPKFGQYSALQAACLSLSQCLRAELRTGGVRVMNVFSGPLDVEWFQTLPPPKVAPRALAAAVARGLKEGVEDVFVGEVADDIRKRFAANPKALERELGE